jgi:hypothetical protein
VLATVPLPAGCVVPVPCHGPGRRPMHCTGLRVVPARARCRPCHVSHGPCRGPCRRPVGHLEIYRERGVVSRRCLEMTVARVWGTRVQSNVPRVTFFTKILRVFRGNGSSESTRFPEGLVLGNWVKTFHPRNFRYVKTPVNSRKHTEKSQLKISLS